MWNGMAKRPRGIRLRGRFAIGRCQYLNSLHIRQLKYRSANSTAMQRLLVDLCFMVVL